MFNRKPKRRKSENYLGQNILGVVLALIVIMIALNTTPGKNLIGEVNHFGTCPNCGDSWSWKSNNVLLLRPPEVVPAKGSMVVPNAGVIFGVAICQECLASPNDLDTAKINGSLKKSAWSPQNIILVDSAVVKYQRGEAGILMR